METISENIDGSISMFRIVKGKEEILYANSSFYKLIGVEPEKYNHNLEAFNHLFLSDEDYDKVEKAIRYAVISGSPGEVEHQFHRQDGTVLWLNRRYAAVKQDEPDTYLLISIVTDVTERKAAEIETALEQHRYQLVIDELDAAVFEWNMEDGSFYSSPAYEKYALSKVKNEDILHNRGPMEVIYPEDQPTLQEFFRRTAAGEGKVEVQLRMKMLSGEYHRCRLIGLYYRDQEKKLERAIGIIIDVNEEWNKSFMLDSLLNAVPGGVAILKFGERVECQYYNDGFARLSGRSREEIDEILKKGNIFETAIAPTDVERSLKEIDLCVAEGKPLNMTYRYPIKDQRIGWLHVSGTKYREEDGKPVYYCIFTNPTNETALYQNIVEDSATGVFVADRKTRRILYMNDGLGKLFQIPQSRLRHRVVNSDPLPGDYVFLQPEDVDALQEDRYKEFHVTWKDKLYLGINAKAINWNGIDAYIMYFTDETAEHEHQLELQKLIDEVPTGIGIYEIRKGQLTLSYMNDAYYEMLGATREERAEYRGIDTIKAVHPEDLEILHAAIRSLEKGKNRANVRYRVKVRENKWLWWNLTASVVERKEDFLKVYVAFSDCTEMINEQKEKEQKYEEQLRLKDVMSKDALAVSSYNLTQNRFTSVSTTIEKTSVVLGLETVDATVNAIRENTLNDEEKAKFAPMYDCKTMLQTYEKGISHIEICHHLKGDPRWMQSSFDMITNPYTGDVEAMAILRDITDIVRAELVVNRLLTVDYETIMTIDARTGVTVPFREADKNKILDRVNFVYIKQKLETMPIYENLYTIHEKGKKYHKRAIYAYLEESKDNILCAIQDVTETYEAEVKQKKKLEEALHEVEQANESKTDFFARMSHDMRTPMNGILGLAELSLDEQDTDALRENMAKIKSSGKYLLSLINDTLDFQKIESGKMTLNNKIIYIKTVFTDMVEMIRPSFEEKGIRFQVVNHNADMDWYVSIDPVRIQQIFINLLSNACKYTPQGGTVTLDVQNIAREGMLSHNCIKVIDTGIGMSEDFIKNQLFHPFAQKQNEVTSQYAGSGLGLSIVKSLVEMMNGRIEIESRMGKGTTFSVYFDFERVDQEKAKKIQADHIEKKVYTQEQLKGKHILIAEDHPLNAQIARKLLEKVGCTTTIAENGRFAVQAFTDSRMNEYDAILMDIRMPVMNGLEASRMIRSEKRADACTIPIIAMTANAYDEDVQKSMDAGMNAHLSKPIEPIKLYETLARYCCTPTERRI
ncbi:MAG: PAS domain-containing protein [Lachnospiraceae bacterium]|nr:PAS domain-containing protein [Lachnospiraceae bacterium]